MQEGYTFFKTNFFRYPTKREMTLDHGCKPTIKGHFCSLLVSNIICLSSLSVVYPSSSSSQLPKTHSNFFLNREYRLFSVCTVGTLRGEFRGISYAGVQLYHHSNFWSEPHTLYHTYYLWSHKNSLLQNSRSRSLFRSSHMLSLCKSPKLNVSLDCTSFLSFPPLHLYYSIFFCALQLTFCKKITIFFCTKRRNLIFWIFFTLQGAFSVV